MAEYDVKVIVDGPDGFWAGSTDVEADDLPEALRVLFELGGLPADALAEAADAGDDRAAAALEAPAAVRALVADLVREERSRHG